MRCVISAPIRIRILSELLPLAVEREQRADLEVAGGDVERPGDARPFSEVAEAGPARDAVVDDEQVAARQLEAHSVALPSLTASPNFSDRWLC